MHFHFYIDKSISLVLENKMLLLFTNKTLNKRPLFTVNGDMHKHKYYIMLKIIILLSTVIDYFYLLIYFKIFRKYS